MYKIRFKEAMPIVVQEAIQLQNEIGEVINTWQDTTIINAEIQPLRIKSSRDLAGITETSTHRLFTTDSIKSNQKLITTKGNFIVQTVQDWTTHKEAILEEVNV